MSQILPTHLQQVLTLPSDRRTFCTLFRWYALPWTSSKIDISLQTCSASFSNQMTQKSTVSSYNTSTFPLPSHIYLSTRLTVFFILIQLLIFPLFLQSCPFPFFWKCSFHLLNSFTYQSGWLLFININLTAFTETLKMPLDLLHDLQMQVTHTLLLKMNNRICWLTECTGCG